MSSKSAKNSSKYEMDHCIYLIVMYRVLEVRVRLSDVVTGWLLVTLWVQLHACDCNCESTVACM